mgnify:CR=1 FL=1
MVRKPGYRMNTPFVLNVDRHQHLIDAFPPSVGAPKEIPAGVAQRDASGRSSRVVGTVADITLRKRLEEVDVAERELLSLIAACIALPLLLRGIEKSPDEKRHNEVREAWKKTAVAAIHALEAEEPAETDSQDAAQAALATELKARLMSEYRHQLEVFNDSVEAQALARHMDLLERKLRLKALRAQRLELYSLSRHHQIGDDVLREVLAELDMGEANLGYIK